MTLNCQRTAFYDASSSTVSQDWACQTAIFTGFYTFQGNPGSPGTLKAVRCPKIWTATSPETPP